MFSPSQDQIYHRLNELIGSRCTASENQRLVNWFKLFLSFFVIYLHCRESKVRPQFRRLHKVGHGLGESVQQKRDLTWGAIY